MRVSEIMTKAAVIDQPDDTLAEAARKMWKQQTGSLLVMDGDHHSAFPAGSARVGERGLGLYPAAPS